MNWKSLEDEVLQQEDILAHYRDQLVREAKYLTSLLKDCTLFSPQVEDNWI